MIRPDPLLDPVFLRQSQYRNDRQLAKRIVLHQRFSTSQQSWFDWLFTRMEFPEHPRVLEIGCGTGALWRENRHRLPSNLDLTLTDLPPGMLETARQQVQGIAHNVVVADARDLPFDAAMFDVVIANHVLHHVPDLPRAIGEICRVLKPSGRLYAGANGLHHMEDLLLLLPDTDQTRAVTRHFNLENGKALLDRAFLHVESYEFDNDLEVTDVQPVIDYLESTQDATILAPGVLDAVRQRAGTAIAEQGAFRIRKSTGIFIADGIREPD